MNHLIEFDDNLYYDKVNKYYYYSIFNDPLSLEYNKFYRRYICYNYIQPNFFQQICNQNNHIYLILNLHKYKHTLAYKYNEIITTMTLHSVEIMFNKLFNLFQRYYLQYQFVYNSLDFNKIYILEENEEIEIILEDFSQSYINLAIFTKCDDLKTYLLKFLNKTKLVVLCTVKREIEIPLIIYIYNKYKITLNYLYDIEDYKNNIELTDYNYIFDNIKAHCLRQHIVEFLDKITTNLTNLTDMSNLLKILD